MRLTTGFMALLLAALVGCGGGHDSKKPAQEASNKVTDKAELEKLSKIEAEMPKNVLTRVPMVDGKPQFNKAEVITVLQSVDVNSPAAMSKAFETATPEQRIKDVGVADDLTEGSTEQCGGRACGCVAPAVTCGVSCCGAVYPRRGLFWRRPVYVVQAAPVAAYGMGYGAGYGGYVQPYNYAGGCCQTYQSGCGMSSSSYYSYSSFQSSSYQTGGYGNNWYGSGYPM